MSGSHTHHTTQFPPQPREPAQCSCESGGRCVRAEGAWRCVCSGPWGGARCDRYVGHDHACAALRCAPPALCLWADQGVHCACPAGDSCTLPPTPASPAALPPPTPAPAGSGAVWAGALVALLCALCVALLVLRRRRQRGFSHARLADGGVEINNPMYLAGDDEPEPPHPANGGSHFANPVYESVYVPHDNHAAPRAAPRPAQEALLRARLPPERSALL